jgi:hypothetical protein
VHPVPDADLLSGGGAADLVQGRAQAAEFGSSVGSDSEHVDEVRGALWP